MDDKKPTLSFSQIEMYAKCGEQYRRRYIEKDVLPPAIALVRGASVHSGAEANFKQKINSHVDLEEREIKEIVSSTFDAKIKNEGILLTAYEEKIGKAETLAEAKDKTVGLAGVFRREVAPAYQPTLVEQSQEVILPDSDKNLIIKIDLVDSEQKIVDLKTSSRSKSQDDIDKNMQFTIYGLGYYALTGKKPAGYIMEVLVDTKIQKRQRLETVRDENDFLPLFHRMDEFARSVKAGVFMPAAPTWWGCSERFCGYWRTCKYVKK